MQELLLMSARVKVMTAADFFHCMVDLTQAPLKITLKGGDCKNAVLVQN